MGTIFMEMRQRGQMTLTPRLQQSVRLLQLSALDFAQELQQALATNPFLEEIEDEPGSEIDGLLPGTTDPATAGESIAQQEPGDDTLGDTGMDPGIDPRIDPRIDHGDASDSYGDVSSGSYNEGQTSATRTRDDGETDWTEWTESTPTLHEHLRGQLQLSHLSLRDRALCELLIEALDDDGYLRQSFDELAPLMRAEPPVDEVEWNAALKLVQSLEPAGVGARDLRECLLAQLPAAEDCSPEQALARRAIVDHLQSLARQDLTGLERWLDASPEQIRAVYQLIRRLDPHPGWRFGRPDTRYIVPDVIVRKIKGRWVTSINPAVLPRVCVNRMYAELFQSNRTPAHAQLASQLQEARWLIRSSEQRFTTIQRVAEAVVAQQRAYLEYGELAMKPLGLRHVAAELGLHESTVSRVTSNKYMSTPRGLVEFRRFFSRELKTDTGGTCSATAIRALIREMIGSEKSGLPLSDAQLAQLLGEQGIQVARRTVTKYRRQLQVPSVEVRRRALC
jgi:RNA polymerase sigma-54 factor